MQCANAKIFNVDGYTTMLYSMTLVEDLALRSSSSDGSNAWNRHESIPPTEGRRS